MTPDTTSTGRRLMDIDAGGGCIADLGASDSVGITNCEFTNLIFTEDTKKARVVGNRIANGAIPVVMEVLGLQHSFSGNICSGDIEIAGSGIRWDESNVADIPGFSLTDTSGGNTNVIDSKRASYTPVWTAATTAPDIGNGTIKGEFERDGHYVVARGSLNFGSTTTFGAGVWSVSLPVVPKTSTNTIIGVAFAFDNGASYLVGNCQIQSSGTTLQFIIGAAPVNRVTPTVPITWANGDRIEWEIRYRVN